MKRPQDKGKVSETTIMIIQHISKSETQRDARQKGLKPTEALASKAGRKLKALAVGGLVRARA